MVRVALVVMFAVAAVGDNTMAPASTETEILRRAEQEFLQGVEMRNSRDKAVPHFQVSVKYFEELRRRGIRNPGLYRDLGNASLLANDLPRAILSYRRGLQLDPTDLFLQAGLNEARSRVVYATTGGFGRPPADQPLWLSRYGSEPWFFGAMVCYALGCLAATRWLMTRGVWLILPALVALAAAAALTALIVFATQSERRAREQPLAVIADDGVLLRKGDGRAFPARYDAPLNKGVEVRRLFQRGDWSQVELSGGEVGWVRNDALLVEDP